MYCNVLKTAADRGVWREIDVYESGLAGNYRESEGIWDCRLVK